MTPKRIAINGFGRIGRTILRLLANDPRFNVVAINDIGDIKTMTHLFRYDSVHGINKSIISHTESQLIVDGHVIQFLNCSDPSSLPWAELQVDIVLECSGVFKTKSSLEKHLRAGADKVLLSVPPDDDDIQMIVLGVNDHLLTPLDRIVSNASCTTNNAAPMIYLIDKICGIESCYITTVHSYTGDQRLIDAPHKDLRRSRAATQSIIPTTTGAAKALTRIFPHLTSQMGGCGIRVPVPDGSLTDITCHVRNPLSIAAINQAFYDVAHSTMRGIIEYTEDPIVSVDVIGNAHSCVFDASLTSVIGNMVKVVGWYDNEFGYSSRLRDVLVRMSE